MKYIVLTLFLSPILALGQVGIGTNTPDASAILDVSSSTKGILIPRVSDPSSISNPAKGLMVFNTSSGKMEINMGDPGIPAWEEIIVESNSTWHDSTTYIINNAARQSGNIQVFTDDGNLGIGTRNPQGAVDIQSTTGALIVPRMTSTQADVIPLVNGSIVYITSSGGSTFSSVGFWFYENGSWVKK